MGEKASITEFSFHHLYNQLFIFISLYMCNGMSRSFLNSAFGVIVY